MILRHLNSHFFILFALLLTGCAKSTPINQPGTHSMNHSFVTVKTTAGNIKIELFDDKAPETVKNFLRYVDEKQYNDTIFHRVIDGFMIQGGGFTEDFKQKSTHAPIRNEASRELQNKKGTIAMARTSDVNSATCQFFINVADNRFLNFQEPTPSGYGYCVFGQVTEGLDIVDKISKCKTGSYQGHRDVPLETIKIIEITKSH